jgi:hypothetical protein
MRLGIGEHHCNELDRFAKAHLITQETAGVRLGQLALQEPLDALVLIRRNETGLEHFEAYNFEYFGSDTNLYTTRIFVSGYSIYGS